MINGLLGAASFNLLLGLRLWAALGDVGVSFGVVIAIAQFFGTKAKNWIIFILLIF